MVIAPKFIVRDKEKTTIVVLMSAPPTSPME